MPDVQIQTAERTRQRRHTQDTKNAAEDILHQTCHNYSNHPDANSIIHRAQTLAPTYERCRSLTYNNNSSLITQDIIGNEIRFINHVSCERIYHLYW